MKRKLIFSAICSVVFFIVAFAMICPNMQGVKWVHYEDPLITAAPVDGMPITAGTLSQDGTVTPDGESQLVVQFNTDAGEVIKSLQINYKEPIKYTLTFAVERTIDGTYVDLPAVYANVNQGDEYCSVRFDGEEYTSFRIWFPKECMLEGVSFYSQEPTRELYEMKNSLTRYMFVICATLFVFVAAFYLDKFFDFSGKIVEFFKAKYKKALFLLCGTTISILIGILAEVVFRLIYGPDSIGRHFNTATGLMFCAIFVSAFIFVVERKNFAQKPERVLLAMLLVWGTFIVLAQPMGHNSWDVDTHYSLAVENSYLGAASYSGADIEIKYNGPLAVTKRSLEESENAKQGLNAIGEGVVLQSKPQYLISHIPSGVAIAVARMFGANFYTRYIFGQLANVFIYAVLCYFAVKKLKSGKMVASTIALFPITIFIASNYAYDQWVTGFTLLGVCYFVSECEQPDKPISLLDTIIMCGSFAVGALPKLIYILMMAFPIFMRKNWKDKKTQRSYYFILIAFFAVVFGMFMIRSLAAIAPATTGDTRGGDVNPSEQLNFILTSPLQYAKILINFLKDYISPFNMQYVSFLAYLGKSKGYIVFQIVLLFTMLTGKNGDKSNCPWWIRALSVAMYVGMAALMATALYIDFTPLKSETIAGCQPRYLIPLLPPMCLTLFGSGIRVFKNKAVYNTAILAVLSTTVIYSIVKLIVIPMM